MLACRLFLVALINLRRLHCWQGSCCYVRQRRGRKNEMRCQPVKTTASDDQQEYAEYFAITKPSTPNVSDIEA